MQRSFSRALTFALVAAAVTAGLAVVAAPYLFPERCEPALFQVIGCDEIGIIIGLTVAPFAAAITFAASRSRNQ